MDDEDFLVPGTYRQACPSCKRPMRRSYNDDDPELLISVWVCPFAHSITITTQEHPDYSLNVNVRGWYLTEKLKSEQRTKMDENTAKVLEERRKRLENGGA